MAIPADVQFRPERNTPRPRINGTMNATIDAAGDGQYAEIDDEGRYKVVLPFDQSGNSEGRASRWVRMAQPYSGANYGMHFPLHKGTEVLLTFIDGDPDRPIISGSVPNPDTMSPVTGGNQTASVIRTGGGNQIRIEDNDGGQQIHLSSPTMDSKISIGAPNEGNIFINSAGDLVQKIVGPETHRTGGKAFWEFKGTYEKQIDQEAKYIYRNDVLRRTIGNTREEFIGTKFSKSLSAVHDITVGVKTTENLAATHELFVGAKVSETIGATREIFVGSKKSMVIASTSETFVGIKRSKSLALSITTTAGASIEVSDVKKLNEAPINEIKGKAAVKITCGGSSIVMSPGSIKIKSSQITLESGGAEVRLGGEIWLDGKTHITEDTKVYGKFEATKKLFNPSISSN
jgi:type VI secretion system secreted protein VgrG